MNENLKTCGKPSRGRYGQGCRCFMCRAANAQYEYDRSHGLTEVRGMVGEKETAEARKRVEKWRGQGVGLRTIELWTGVPRSSLQTLVRGNHPNCNGLPRRMSRDNYEAIMSAKPQAAGGARIDSARARDALGKLREAGLTFPAIARLSGIPAKTLHALAYRDSGRCSVSTSKGLLNALDIHAGKAKPRANARLEDWQWAEARIDYAKGTTAEAIAERYGVRADSVRAHMRKHGVVFAQQAQLATASVRR